MNRFVIFCGLTLVLIACKTTPKEITISDKGISKYRIIYGDKASAELVTAIQSFKNDLNIITGSDIQAFSDIVGEQKEEILIGSSSRTEKLKNSLPLNEIGDHGYFSGVRGNKWVITANKTTALKEGLFDVLNNLGSIKLSETMTQYSKRSPLIIPANDITHMPDFNYRQIINPAALNPEYRKWNHINISNQEDWGTWGYSTESIFPSESYFKTNPAIYAQVDNRPIERQINFSSPEMLVALEKNLQVWSIAKGRAPYWSISPYSNHIVSEDELTKKTIEETGSAAAVLLKTVNTLAEKNKDRTYAIWLDGPYRKAPTNTVPLGNVLIVLDTKDVNHAASLGEGIQNGAFRKDLAAWKKLTSNIAVVSHVTNEENFMMPFPNLTAIQNSLKYLKAEGIDKIIFSGLSTTGAYMADMKFYIASNLAWNSSQNLDSLIWKYCDNTYGKAGKSMMGYIQALERTLQSSKSSLYLNQSPAQSFKSWLAPNVINQLYSYFNATTTLAQNNSELRAKLDLARLGLIYTQLSVAQSMGTKTFGYFMNLGALKATLVRQDQPIVKTKDENFNMKLSSWSTIQGMRDLLNQFVDECIVNGIHVLDAKGTTPDQFRDRILKYITQPVQTHIGFKKGIVNFNSSPDPRYGDGDGTILNDGVIGFPETPQANWLGLKGGNAELTWDLSGDTLVSSVALRFLQNTETVALLPGQVTVLISTDGTNFTPVGTKNISPSPNSTKTESVSFSFGKKMIKAVKIKLSSSELCPSYHIYAGSPSAILMDEVVLK